MKNSPLFRTALELVGAFLVLTLLALTLGHYYVELWMPLYREVAGWLLPEYRVIDLTLRQGANESVLALTAETAGNMLIGLKYLPAGVGMTSTTLAGHALQHPVIIFSLLLAWPTVPRRDRWRLVLCGIPLLVLVALLDIPFVLAGALQDLVFGTLAPDQASFSVLIGWVHFLNGGGRLLLSITAVLLAVSVYTLLVRQPRTNSHTNSIANANKCAEP